MGHYLTTFTVVLTLALNVGIIVAFTNESTGTIQENKNETYFTGYDHGCNDAKITVPQDRYISQPGKGPSNQSGSFVQGYNDGFRACYFNLLDFLIKNIFPVLSTFGIASLAWNFYNFYQTQKGYLKLKLECKCEYYKLYNQKYIICKTSVENTGRTPIKICQAYLDITNGDKKHELLSFYSDPSYNVRIGGMENSQYTFIHRVTMDGIYKIEFRVVGERYIQHKNIFYVLNPKSYFVKDYLTHNRTIKDSVVVNSSNAIGK